MIEFIDEDGLISPRGDKIDAEIAVTTFSNHLYEQLIRCSGAKPHTVLKGSVDIDVLRFTADGRNIAVYRTPVGAPAAVSAMEEVFCGGVRHIIAFGICGTLIHTPPHTLIVPDRAYRDEGTSYHYAPAADYIDVKNSGAVRAALDGYGINTLTGGVWTTDGFYRETRTRADKMRGNGCIAVDMECAALQAYADFRRKDYSTFFITADSLAGETWQPNDILDLKATDSTAVAVRAALRLARRV